MALQHFDFAVIGAGFGGLATALELARGVPPLRSSRL